MADLDLLEQESHGEYRQAECGREAGRVELSTRKRALLLFVLGYTQYFRYRKRKSIATRVGSKHLMREVQPVYAYYLYNDDISILRVILL